MAKKQTVRYLGTPSYLDGASAVVHCESRISRVGVIVESAGHDLARLWREANSGENCDGGGRPPGVLGVSHDREVIPALMGLAMSGVRATCFPSASAFHHFSAALVDAAERPLPLVIHLASRARDPYPDLPGWVSLHAESPQAAADLTVIARKVAEQALVPVMVVQDATLTTRDQCPVLLPEPDLIAEYLGEGGESVPSPTPAQEIFLGRERLRTPRWWNVDRPAMAFSRSHGRARAARDMGRKLYFLTI